MLKATVKALIPAPVLAIRRRLLAARAWRARDYAPPTPPHIKERVLRRNGLPAATWVETGTFRGDMSLFLARCGGPVITIEPDPDLCQAARKRFKDHDIELIEGLSENVFPHLLPRLSGDVNFWLDGHWSGGPTFHGPDDTPILVELECIARNRDRFDRLAVLIDDVRCFNPIDPDYATYPPLRTLIKWAEDQGMDWHIEHDILIAKS